MRPHLFLGLLDHFDLHHSRRGSDLQSGPLAHLRHRLGSTHPRDERLEHHPQHTPLLDTRPRYIRLPHSFPGRTDLLGRPLERRLPQHTPLEDTRLHYSLHEHRRPLDNSIEQNLLHSCLQDTRPQGTLEHIRPDHGCILAIRDRHRPSLPGSRP